MHALVTPPGSEPQSRGYTTALITLNGSQNKSNAMSWRKRKVRTRRGWYEWKENEKQ